MFTNTSRAGVAALALLWGAAALGAEDNPPLIALQLSEQTLNRMIDETIERESDVNEIVLATHVVGKAKTTGKPSISLVDCDSGPTIKAMFTGSVVSRTTGYHPPVVIYSRSQTDFTVEKLLAVEQLGAVVPNTTKIQASTNTETENITTNRRGLLGRIVLRRAWRAVAANEPEANAIAQRDAERQIMTAFDEALAKRVERVQMRLSLRALVAAILPAGATPAYRSVTKDGYLTMAVFGRAPNERIVNIRLPELTAKSQPVQMWLHKSVVGENLNLAGGGVELARRCLTFPSLLISAAADEPQRGPQWITAGDWYVVQLSGTEN